MDNNIIDKENSVELKELIDNIDTQPDEKIKELKNLFILLSKVVKTLKLYLDNNPTRKKFTQEFYNKFNIFLKNHKEVILRVDSFQIIWNDIPVYENDNRIESIAFKMYVDSIRLLTFREGLSKEIVLQLTP